MTVNEPSLSLLFKELQVPPGNNLILQCERRDWKYKEEQKVRRRDFILVEKVREF
jgi:hypothetical protein